MKLELFLYHGEENVKLAKSPWQQRQTQSLMDFMIRIMDPLFINIISVVVNTVKSALIVPMRLQFAYSKKTARLIRICSK